MGTLFPDCPDYAAFPTLFAEAVRLNLLPRLIAALLLAGLVSAELEHENPQPHTHADEFVLPPRSPDVSIRLTGVSATGSVGTVTAGVLPPDEMPFEQPHTHSEIEDPPPPASHFDIIDSTSGGSSEMGWLGGNSQEVANDIIRRHWETRRRAHYVMTHFSTSMSPALLDFASRASS